MDSALLPGRHEVTVMFRPNMPSLLLTTAAGCCVGDERSRNAFRNKATKNRQGRSATTKYLNFGRSESESSAWSYLAPQASTDAPASKVRPRTANASVWSNGRYESRATQEAKPPATNTPKSIFIRQPYRRTKGLLSCYEMR